MRSTAGIIEALGATVERVRDDGRNVDYRVISPGADGLHEPAEALDCGNSGTSLRLVAGMIAGLPLKAVLDGDDSLRRRPVARIVEPLRSMGAVLQARDDDSHPPLTVVGATPLRPIDYRTPVPSAQVKSAILLAGLRAEGRTTVREAVATRDHTERMLRARGVPVERLDGSDAVAWTVEGGRTVRAIDERVPGDASAAAFWLVAGAIHDDAELTIRDVGVNPTRRAVIDILALDGRADRGTTGGRSSRRRRGGRRRATRRPDGPFVRAPGDRARPGDVAAAIDEIPILCLAATQARGTTAIRGAAELRHKESDRLAGIAAGLDALGARVDVEGDDLRILGGTRLRGAATDSLDDHRLAMTFAIAGLIADGETSVGRPASAGISYPGFFGELERIGA